MSLTQGPLRVVLFEGKTVIISQPQKVNHYSNLTIYLKGAGTINGGTLLVEEADFDTTSGAVAWSSVTGDVPIDCTEVSGGAQKAYQLPIGAYSYVRARTGDAITGGGTIDAVLVCN